MKWLTKEWIKKHSRIDFDCEDDLLEMYGDDAEQTVLNIIDRTYEELMETYGEVPKPLYVAALMLVELDYDHRSLISGQQQYLIPNSFDMKVKPYMRLTSNNKNDYEYGCKNL